MQQVVERRGFDDECLAWVKRDEFPIDQAAAERGYAAIHVLYGERAFSEWLEQTDPVHRDVFETAFNEHLYPIREYAFPANTLPLSKRVSPSSSKADP